MSANIIYAMSSNSKTKARPTIPGGGHDIIGKEFFDEEKSSGNLKYQTRNAKKRATATTRKSEATVPNRSSTV
jgi:hypothetical protein